MFNWIHHQGDRARCDYQPSCLFCIARAVAKIFRVHERLEEAEG